MINKFGDKLRHLRETNKLNQSELAAKLGLSETSKGYISELESSKKKPTAELVLRVALLFRVTTDYLLLDEQDAP